MLLDNRSKAILSDPRKRWEWIKYQLKLQNTSLAKIAKNHGVSRQCLYQVRYTPYPKSEKLIADSLGLNPAQIFPDRYDEDGLPNRGHHQKYTPPHTPRNVKVA